MRRPFRRGWEGEGKQQADALAQASGQSPPPGNVCFRIRERGGKALGVPAQGSRKRPDQTSALLHRTQCETQACLRVKPERSALQSAQHGTERVHQTFSTIQKPRLIVTRSGRD